MPSNSSVALLLLKTVILNTLLSAEAYGVPLPVILKAGKQLGQVMLCSSKFRFELVTYFTVWC